MPILPFPTGITQNLGRLCRPHEYFGNKSAIIGNIADNPAHCCIVTAVRP